jgi:4-hydroxy-tetrahydrodipicolinate synthase
VRGRPAHCHDDYLLPALTQGIDGALVGLGCFVPDLIVALMRAVDKRDLAEAVAVYDRIYTHMQAVYRMDQPSAASHARMEEAMFQRGPDPQRAGPPPVIPFARAEKDALRAGLTAVGQLGTETLAV